MYELSKELLTDKLAIETIIQEYNDLQLWIGKVGYNNFQLTDEEVERYYEIDDFLMENIVEINNLLQ